MRRLFNSFVVGLVLIAGYVAQGDAQGKNASQKGGGVKPDGNLMTIGRSGQVLHSASTTAIYWGSGWTDDQLAGDIITGLDSFFNGFGGSQFAEIATEYYDSNGPITSSSTYLGHVIDLSEPPAGALSSSEVIAEACSTTNNNPDPEGVYFVYTSTAVDLPGTCAIRSYGTCGRRRPIQVVYVPYMTGDGARCSGALAFGDDGSVTGHSAALAQYGNVTGNQLMATITNPRGTGWQDASGDDITFKCDNLYPSAGTYALFSNGSLWTERMKWSNAAYLAGTGAPNRYGLPGCVF